MIEQEAISSTVWACSICSYLNKGSSDLCELCGVKTSIEPSPTLPSTNIQDSSTCTVCTFMNHPSMSQCEMCGADLPREIVPTTTTSSSSSISTDNTSTNAQIRLSFRRGGQSAFLTKLKSAVAEKQWEKVHSIYILLINTNIKLAESYNV